MKKWPVEITDFFINFQMKFCFYCNSYIIKMYIYILLLCDNHESKDVEADHYDSLSQKDIHSIDMT